MAHEMVCTLLCCVCRNLRNMSFVAVVTARNDEKVVLNDIFDLDFYHTLGI